MAEIVLTNDIQLHIKRIPNIELLAIKDTFPKPKIPQFYIESQERYIENPDHPDYHQALRLKELSIASSMYDHILNNCVQIAGNEKDLIRYCNPKILRGLKGGDLNLERIKQIVEFFSVDAQIINEAVLTEARVQGILNMIPISRNNQDIYTVDVRNALNTSISVNPIFIGQHGIQLVHPVDEFTAVKNSFINWSDWIRNELTLDEMATTIALYRATQVIELHVNDAQQIESERQSRRNNRN